MGTRTWTERASGVLLTGLNWSGSYLYFQDLLEPDQPVYRWGLSSKRSERVADFRESAAGSAARIGLAGLTPGGDLLLILSHGRDDIYSLDVD